MRDDRRHDGEMEMILASIRDQSVILQRTGYILIQPYSTGKHVVLSGVAFVA
jgi:hypothetical protein